jgi:hypothetical protein
MDVCIVDKSVIQSLLQITSWKRIKLMEGKLKILKDGRLCPSSSKVKFADQ